MAKVYISGGITNVPNYMDAFRRAEDFLQSQGFETINPAKILYHMPTSTKHKEYMDICFPLLDQCEFVYMLDGWEESRGANQEYGYAYAKDKSFLKE